jgi:hypothetical protein
MIPLARIPSSILAGLMLAVVVIAGCCAIHLALSEVPRNVLNWIMFGLAAWLGIGVLTAWLFGGFVSGSRHSWESRIGDEQN